MTSSSSTLASIQSYELEVMVQDQQALHLQSDFWLQHSVSGDRVQAQLSIEHTLNSLYSTHCLKRMLGEVVYRVGTTPV